VLASAAIVAKVDRRVRIPRDPIKGLDLLLPRIIAIECFVRESPVGSVSGTEALLDLDRFGAEHARQDPATQATIDGAKIDLSDITLTLN
jgi:hypothetical protein